MSTLNEGDWGGDDLPLWIRERIREVDHTLQQLVASIRELNSAVVGMALGAEIGERSKAATH